MRTSWKMTGGQRWTFAGCVGLSIVLLVFGMPKSRSPVVNRLPAAAPAGVTSASGPVAAAPTLAGHAAGPLVAPPASAETTTTTPSVEETAVTVAPAPPTGTTRRSTPTTARPPTTTTTTAPCSLPLIAGQCLPVPVP